MSLPLVTCLCLTTEGRGDWLKRAAKQFQNQHYPNKELLIVADTVDDVSGLERPDDCAVVLTGRQYNDENWAEGPRLNIGQKRNVGASFALGEFIAVWDDDDTSGSRRLISQVYALQNSNLAVTGYRTMKFTDGASWWQFSLADGLVFGTSLMFRKDWWKKHPFPEIQIGEDMGFASEAAAENQLASCPDLGLMYATIHPKNTSPKRVTTDPGWVLLPGFEWSDNLR